MKAFTLIVCLACAAVVRGQLTTGTFGRTFGIGVPNFPVVPDEERLVYNHSLAHGSPSGYLNHFWSTACGGRSINCVTESGVIIYRIYVDGEANASIVFTPRMATGQGFSPSCGGADGGASLPEPWGTDLFGKQSDLDGYYFKFRVPFYLSIRVTAQLPPGVAGFNVYTIIRGIEGNSMGFPALSVPGYGAVPYGTRLRLLRNDAIQVPSLHFIPIVNITAGTGFIHSYTVATTGHPSFYYLEGCFHLVTPVGPDGMDPTTGVANGFPGVVLSTGTEDMFDSSFYFHAGMFALKETGVTHMCGTMAPHKPCPNASVSEWSAYKVHETDLLLFDGGVQLLLRNGDKAGPTPYGSGKCYNQDMVPDGMSPGTSTVSTYAWVYLFE